MLSDIAALRTLLGTGRSEAALVYLSGMDAKYRERQRLRGVTELPPARLRMLSGGLTEALEPPAECRADT